jgi:hypothetical protein
MMKFTAMRAPCALRCERALGSAAAVDAVPNSPCLNSMISRLPFLRMVKFTARISPASVSVTSLAMQQCHDDCKPATGSSVGEFNAMGGVAPLYRTNRGSLGWSQNAAIIASHTVLR